MPCDSVTAKETVPSLFLDGIDKLAFDPDAPFFDIYTSAYLVALANEDADVLTVHREAIYYLNEDYAYLVLAALIIVAAKNPSAGFVESLAFYFSNKCNRNILKRRIERAVDVCVSGICNSLILLEDSLNSSGDEDMASSFNQLRMEVFFSEDG